ncbi:MAG: ribulokinase [Puniceicoccales bacterium]|jgi:L-ribulokinase|nr:ribulokinase [Puniceicoccales bacterium]
MAYSIGLDYGTNSTRVLVVDCADGREIGLATIDYPSGEQGVFLDASNHLLARQHPADYLFALEHGVKAALEAARKAVPGFSSADVVGIGVDGTGSSPLPVDARNKPLALSSRFARNLNAFCWLWKDHTSIPEAALITQMARRKRPRYLARIGGIYSSEWFWAKIWHCLKTDPTVFDAAHSWVELSDYIPSVLAGANSPSQIVRGVCMAGHKAMYAKEWGGLPDEGFLAALDPKLAALRDRLYTAAHDASTPAGKLCPKWARQLGLPIGIPIAIGEMDVHYGAIACGVEEGTLVKVIGTSTCDCAVAVASKRVANVPGICGIVNGSILPGYIGIEAGQSAVGDIFKWFVERVLGDASAHVRLTKEASALRPGQSGLLALDWNNGNRTILVDQSLTGLLLGQTLYTTPAEIYRALIEATAFGARAIIERLREYGVPVRRIVCSGGIAEKNSLLMQIYADVTGCEIRVSRSSQACALGAAVSATVAAGVHRDFKTAQAAMTGLKSKTYRPIRENQIIYDKLYAQYKLLHDAFGNVVKTANLGRVMKDLLALKTQS